MKKTSKKIFIVIIIFLFILIWAYLTKSGVIANFLGIQALEPNAVVVPGSGNNSLPGSINPGIEFKPVIYLYPAEEKNVSVKLDYQGDLISTYPKYENGWKVAAHPDGRIINEADGREYSYLFWEGESSHPVDYDLSQGFVVRGSETAEFLQEKLTFLGLTPKEYNEFIVFWLPQMEKNNYNLIHFASDCEYSDRAKLDIVPKPDSMQRVFMVFKSLEENADIQEQVLQPFSRVGFSVVEWGGTEVK